MKRTTRSKPEIVKAGNIAVRIYKRSRRIANTKGELREYVSFYVADHTSGERQWRIFSDHDEARQEATRIARQLASGETTAAQMRNADAASYGRALELIRPTGLSLEIAAAIISKAVAIVGADNIIPACNLFKQHGAGQVENRKVADVIVELIANREARGKSGAYVQDLRNRLARFAKFTGADVSTIYEPQSEIQPDTRNRGADIASITTSDIQKWLDGLKLSPQSAKNFRTVLNTLFGFAESRGYIFKGRNPVEATESIEVKNGDVEIFTPDEMARLLAAAPERFQAFLAISAFAGLRSAEIQRLEWSDIDLASGFITIKAAKAKTASRRPVPIMPNLKAWLKPHAKQTGLVWSQTANDLQDDRSATVKNSGVAWKDNACRHSFVSYRLAMIQNAAQVALEAGNSADVVFKHYRELVKPDAAQKWFAITPNIQPKAQP